MIRAAKLAAVFGAFCMAASAQTPIPDPVAAQEQAVQKTSAAWVALAKDLDARMARLLPCDPKAAAAIREVSNASEARLAAIADYMRAAIARAGRETAALKVLATTEESRAAQLGLERADTAAELNAIESQTENLAQSTKQVSSFEETSQVLGRINAMVRTRVQQNEQQDDGVIASLHELSAKFQARDAALTEQAVAFEAERARWDNYYTARLARAKTECSVVNIGPAPAKPAGKNK